MKNLKIDTDLITSLYREVEIHIRESNETSSKLKRCMTIPNIAAILEFKNETIPEGSSVTVSPKSPIRTVAVIHNQVIGDNELTAIAKITHKKSLELVKGKVIKKKYAKELTIAVIRMIINTLVAEPTINYALNKAVDLILPGVFKIVGKSMSCIFNTCCSGCCSVSEPVKSDMDTVEKAVEVKLDVKYSETT